MHKTSGAEPVVVFGPTLKLGGICILECCRMWHRGGIWDFVLTAWAGHSTANSSTTGARLGLGNLAGPRLSPTYSLGKAVQWYKFA